MAVVSIAIHAALLAMVLLVLPTPPTEDNPVPPATVAVVFDAGKRAGPSRPEPEEKQRAAEPKAAPPPTVEQPPTPAPSPPVQPAPPAPPPTAPPPPPTPAPPVPVPPAAVPSPPVAPAAEAPPVPPPPRVAAMRPDVRLSMPPLETPPPPEPLLPPLPEPPRPPAPRRPPSRAQTAFPQPALGNWSLGSPKQGPLSLSPMARVDSADLGADWINALSEWIDQRKYYPRQAAENGDEGEVTLSAVVAADGRVLSVQLERRSGSQWLDMAWQAIFRGAHVPAFPPGTKEAQTTVHLTMHYILIR